MIELSAIRDIVAILGVVAGFTYYVLTVRVNQKNSRISLTNNIMQSLLTEESQRRWIDLINMEWTDYDDFEKKYGSDYNPDNYAKRASVFACCNVLGNLLKRNIADAETFYASGATNAVWVWEKFKPIIIEQRRRYMGSDTYDGLEYLAEEMLKIKRKHDPSFKIPTTFAHYIPEN
jgi:hypothetical protein